MTVMQVVFLITAVVSLGGAVMVVTARNLIHAALWLILTLFGVAVMYGLLSAPFFTVIQIVIYIGAIAIGALIFSFIFWGFGFLRMGTGGLTAQAAGAQDVEELRAVLGRAMVIAVICGLALIVLSPLIETLSFWMITGSPDVEHHARTYFQIRIFAAPFSLINYVIILFYLD